MQLGQYLKWMGVLKVSGTKLRFEYGDPKFNVNRQSLVEMVEEFFFAKQIACIVSPWSAGSRLKGDEPKGSLAWLLECRHPAVKDLRQGSGVGMAAAKKFGADADGEAMRRYLRNNLPDSGAEWIDLCWGIEKKCNPLVGTGGNDGNVDYSRTFRDCIQKIFEASEDDRTWGLRASILDMPVPLPTALQIPSGGRLFPKDPRASVNAWDFVLALEGALAFAGSFFQDDYPGLNRQYFPGRFFPEDAYQGSFQPPLWESPVKYAEVKKAILNGSVMPGTNYDFLARNGQMWWAVEQPRDFLQP